MHTRGWTTGTVVALVVAVGVVAFLTARPAAPVDPPSPPGADPDRTYVVDGRAYVCGSTNTVYLTAEARGTAAATFVVDGVEVAREVEPDGVDALLSGPVTAIHCDDGRTHRIDVVTDQPDGCVLTVSPYGTFAEGKNGAKENGTATAPPGRCSLTVHD